MSEIRKQQIHDLLKIGIETGDAKVVTVVDETRYVQHNPKTKEGDIGLAELFAKLALTHPHVQIIRIFSDGDYVFAHNEYDFSSVKICFEVFRFEGDKTVEHWDNLQAKQPPNQSGRTMVDGKTKVKDLEKTEDNRAFINRFVNEVLIERQPFELSNFFDTAHYAEHSPHFSDDLTQLHAALSMLNEHNAPVIHYQTHHKTLAEGNFVLTLCEGHRGGSHVAFYDMFRLEDGLIVEHWDTIEEIPPKSEWQNHNGKF
ncbi:nuclear transport factor 2 family protein [Enterovibrio coralii]|uniref:SnoaL-like domain-containing protein n=1 Tax=Enterovibrio coralii TaxID=294935 RepID=A0A135IBJ1_9GAMM|nr:hypothetical protein [Enterovibrio coralii]KXF82827.1 hypothetical protein ATN88_23415 [Enterovibrio coralii]